MSERPIAATSSTASSRPSPSTSGETEASSRRSSNRNGKSKKSKIKEESLQAFKGVTPDFGGVFIKNEELPDGKEWEYKEILLAGEVYAAANYPKTSKLLSTLFEDTPTNPSVVPPAEPAGDDAESTLRVKVYMEMLKRHLNEKEVLTNNLHSFFTVLWGQCSPGIQCKLRGKLEFLIKKEDGDCAWLLEEIRQVMYNFSSGRYRLRTLFDAKLDLLKFRQGRLPTFRYFKKYLQQINAFERGGGSIGIDKGMVSYVETWHEDVLDAHPGPPPLQPDAPQVFGGERIDVYTSAEMDAIRDPLETYIHAMDAYSRAYKKW